jgi:hypothetical protein
MTDPRQSKPTPAQQRFLRELAVERGESFTTPSTFAEASAEIRRLKRRKPDHPHDVSRERAEVRRDMDANCGGAAAVRPHELAGYGSRAAWAATTSPLLTVRHRCTEGTTVDGTTAGDGAAEILRRFGFRWASSDGRWHAPRSAGQRPRHARLDALAEVLRVYGFEVELLLDE